MIRSAACDAIVIGAGPAGSAAACTLADAGLRTILVDKHAFPRDKVCGDALIPDAMRALQKLSLWSRIAPRAAHLEKVRIYSPNRRWVEIAGACACVPRVVLDEQMRLAAVERGACFMGGWTATSAIRVGDRVVGAVFSQQDSREQLSITAGVTVLATGAESGVLRRFDMCTRASPSASAARVYYRCSPRLASGYDALCISYDRTICPGYGWVFPGPGGVFNIGVGCFYGAPAVPGGTNLRTLLHRFLETFPPARAIAEQGTLLTPLRGAALRTGLAGSRVAVPGLLAVGEAAGLTYPFTGEGIGKAIESGVLAAEEIIRGLRDAGSAPAVVAERYASRLESEFRSRFAAYHSVQRWLSSPWVADFLAARANSGTYVRGQLQGFLNETADPRELFSLHGVLKALTS